MENPRVLTMIEIKCSQVVGSIYRFGQDATNAEDFPGAFEEDRQICLNRIKEMRKLLREAEKQVKLLQLNAVHTDEKS